MKVKIERIKEYFDRREDVVMAFLFGSFANDNQTADSDIDIAVYFRSENGAEKEKYYNLRSEIFSDMVDILEKDEVDVVVLNWANATLAFNVLKTGLPLVIKDEGLYLDFYLKVSNKVSNEAEDFSNFMQDYLKIKLSARSLTEEADA